MPMADDPQGFTHRPLDANGSYELTLSGKIYADVAPALQDELLGLAERGLKTLIVDACNLAQIDSSGLNVFVHLLKRIRPDGGRIVFFGLNDNLQRVFEITKLQKVMVVKKTRMEAMGSVG